MFFLRFVLLLPVALISVGCIHHDVSDDYEEYLKGNKGEYQFSQVGYEARYYIAPQVRETAIEIRSGMAGAGNVWHVSFGTMLVDTLESDDFREAFESLSETTETSVSDGLLIKYEQARYVFASYQAQVSLRITVERDGQPILTKWYRQAGRSQKGKMMFGGAFGMNNAIQQSTKAALDRVLSNSLSDLQVAMKKPIESVQTASVDDSACATSIADCLEDLKLQHEKGELSDKEYMKKQREIVNEHTRKIRTNLPGVYAP